jgi:hypothetical protein
MKSPLGSLASPLRAERKVSFRTASQLRRPTRCGRSAAALPSTTQERYSTVEVAAVEVARLSFAAEGMFSFAGVVVAAPCGGGVAVAAGGGGGSTMTVRLEVEVSPFWSVTT